MHGSETLEYDDIKIEVPWGYVAGRWYGNRMVRPILAVHGWQDNLGTWDRLIPLLPRHVGILCIDFPGHGRSSKYPKGMNYHVIDFVQIIIRIIKAYNWRKVSLMGHSMGGIVCFIYASMYPHTVDMLIQIDIIKAPNRRVDTLLTGMASRAEKLIIENERLDQMSRLEPPSYTYRQLEDLLSKGTNSSVEKENCKYLLNRSITSSRQYPEKYYFSRDGRVKYYVNFSGEPGLALEMAKRIRNRNYLVVRATKSGYTTDGSTTDLITILRHNNPNFELHEVEGSHHVHLNNPHEVAEALSPFILRHRPVTLDTWSMDADKVDVQNIPYKKASKL